MKLFFALAAITAATAAQAATPAPATVAATTGVLLPVQADRATGKIVLTLPAPGPDGVAARLLYVPTLRTGLGSAPIGLDRAMNGATQLLVFRRIGNKVAVQFENPRFRASNAPAAEQAAVRNSFAITTVWLGPIAKAGADGSIDVDISSFLTRDIMNIAGALQQGGAKGAKRVEDLSVADPASVKAFPDNIEIDAVQTYQSDEPGAEIENIAPDPRQISFTVHHSFVRLPDSGFQSRRFDPRAGGFASQVVDFAAPLGQNVVYDLANRFRLEKRDPAAARSAVKKPIVFYIDRSAPEPIRDALAEGVGWWAQAFDAAGYVDAFQVRILPEDVDPLDVRYNVVNWVNRATRGWSFGQVIVDPRTGEIVKGSVLLGSLRVRQDILIYEALVGAAAIGKGGPNDPVQVALARIRQLGAHEVGHALGLVHNFAGSTQDRASVMDYPAPRVGLRDGVPDLSDAYGSGIGIWDKFAIDWLYGAPPPGSDADAAARAKAQAAVAAGLRFVSDGEARPLDAAQPWGSLWDDGPDATAELARLMGVRRVAVERFGLDALEPGEPVANLRRKFVPVWLLHRYQVEAAAKSVGGVVFSYAVNGDGHETAPPVAPAEQRAALDALLATLSPDALRVPPRLLPLLSAANNANDNRQFDIEVLARAGGPVFDPLVAADVAAQLPLDALLASGRLQRLVLQHAADAQALGLDELLDRLTAATITARQGALGQRIAYRTIVTMARTAAAPATSPEVAAALDSRLRALAQQLPKSAGDGADRAWAASMAQLLGDRAARDRAITSMTKPPSVPPGMPIGGETGWMDGLD